MTNNSNNTFSSGTGMSISFDMGNGSDTAPNTAETHAKADAHVDVYAPKPLYQYDAAVEKPQELTYKDQVHNSFALTAGGEANLEALIQYGSSQRDNTAAKYNAALEDALNGADSATRHNGRSKVESILVDLKERMARDQAKAAKAMKKKG